MKNLVLLQIFAYLFMSPLIIIFSGDSANYRLDLSVLFLVSFVVGLAIAKYKSPPNLMLQAASPPSMTVGLKLCLIVLTFSYVYVVISNQLMVRRQGSEVMAGIFANLPLFYLLILRIYEVVFYPVLLVVLVGLQRDRGTLTKFLLLGFFIGFVFTGVLDSRTKLIIPLLYYYVIFIASKPKWTPIPSKVFVVGGLILGLLAFLIVLGRVSDFEGVSEYFFEDVLRRIDGLELISLVDEVVKIPFWGTLDTLIFGNFIASIPFLEGSTAMKEMGLTSSKSYLLQVILGYTQFDINNSLITDLYYFGGYVLLILGALFYGYIVMTVDISVKTNNIWRSRTKMAFLLSFLVNALRIENDYFSIVFTTVRDFLIIYLLFFGLRFSTSFRVTPG